MARLAGVWRLRRLEPTCQHRSGSVLINALTGKWVLGPACPVIRLTGTYHRFGNRVPSELRVSSQQQGVRHCPHSTAKSLLPKRYRSHP